MNAVIPESVCLRSKRSNQKSTYKFGSKKVYHTTYDCEEWETLSDNRVLIK